VRRAEFQREQQLLLDPSRPRIVLLARSIDAVNLSPQLQLVSGPVTVTSGAPPTAWVNEAMVDPIFGVIFKNERGDHAFVTNTMFDGLQTGRFDAGDEVIYALTFDPLLSDGRHTASPAIAHRDGTRFADWRDDLLSFVIRAERYTGGIVDLPHSSTVERAELSAEAQPA
jgi:hypothetical protein